MHMDTIFAREFISSRMRSTRLAHHATKQAMSQVLHIDPHSYADLENGVYCPSGPPLLLLLDYMGGSAALELIHAFHTALHPGEPPAAREVTQEQLREQIAVWLEDESAQEDWSMYPAVQYEVFEDDSKIVSRLYYIVPKLTPLRLECFVFFEEETLRKEPSGNLTPTGSRLYIQ